MLLILFYTILFLTHIGKSKPSKPIPPAPFAHSTSAELPPPPAMHPPPPSLQPPKSSESSIKMRIARIESINIQYLFIYIYVFYFF
jgi:hypothetical protein